MLLQVERDAELLLLVPALAEVDREGPCSARARPPGRSRGGSDLDRAPVDEDARDARALVEYVAASDREVCDLADLNRAELIRDAEDFRRTQSHRAQGFVARESVVNGLRGVREKVGHRSHAARLERE